MMHIERFINELMSSNCYIIVDEESNHCICIDPASEKCEKEIVYIESKGLTLDYIILTHEHTDHTWGVNGLTERFLNVKVICSEICKQNITKEFQAYFLLYYNNPDYNYTVCRVDETTESLNERIQWQGYDIKFVSVPGHSMGSICVDIEGRLFTGDAIMQSKPYINKRNGSKVLFFESVKKIKNIYPDGTVIYPGHGEMFKLKDMNWSI
jgi:glyoxylase-like metal-dependent hydrolase (beta-lactamase superfamily II)